MKNDTDTLEDLKFVLKTISDIQQNSDVFEERIREINERYRTLDMYSFDVSSEEKEALRMIEPLWTSLFISSKHRDVGLTLIKERFTEITQIQITDFAKAIKVFAEKFARNGPGAVGDDLELGLKLLKAYRDELSKIEREKQDLTNAEKLFNLPISNYPALLHVQKEMRGLEDLYKLYEEQMVSTDGSFNGFYFVYSFRNHVLNGQRHYGEI